MIFKTFRKLFPTWKQFILSVLIGFSTSICVYLGFFQRHFFSKRYLLFSFFMGFAAFVISGWLLSKIIAPYFKKLPKSIKVFSILLSLLFAFLVLINVNIPPVYSSIPKKDLTISIPIDTLSSGGESVRLLWIKNGQGYIHFSQLRIEGNWEEAGKNLLFLPGQTVKIHWQGAIEPSLEIAFRKPGKTQLLQIEAGEIYSEIDLIDFNILNNPTMIDVNQIDGIHNSILTMKSDPTLEYYFPFVFAFAFPVTFVFLVILLILSNFSMKFTKRKQGQAKSLLYSIPMLFVWIIVLMILWPGILTNDGLGQWEQMAEGNFNNWQSAFYSLLIFVLTRIWNSPAPIALAQILFLVGITSYGLKVLDDTGVHPLVLWGISVLFALSPINVIFISTIWKDIPYAISFLWLTIILLQIFLSGGAWIKNWRNVALLCISALCISLFRKNGIAVSISALLTLIFLYYRYWKRYLVGAGVFILFYLLINGPVYSALKIDDEGSSQSNLIFLHHIAAHVDAGTELEKYEYEYLGSFLPLQSWDYWCYYVGPISYNPDFNRQEFLTSGSENISLAFTLFKKDPMVDIRHTLCASELIWRVSNSHKYMKSTHGFSSMERGKEEWVIPNKFGINEASNLPGLVKPFINWLRSFGFSDDFLVWYLRPALYLYLSLFSLSIVHLRISNWRTWIVGLPVITQSAVLFLISFAPAYRYQYGTYLAGLFLLGLIFLPRKDVLESGY